MAMFRKTVGKINFAAKKSLIFLVIIYQNCISPFFGPSCRFYPSCSLYAKIAIDKHGIFQGVWLTIKRVLKCHPWHSGGFDPVPETIIKRK